MANYDLNFPALHGDLVRDDGVREISEDLFSRVMAGEPAALDELSQLADASQRRDVPVAAID